MCPTQRRPTKRYTAPRLSDTLTAMLRKIILAVVLLLLLAAGIVFYLWHQATSLPEWYENPTAAPAVVAAEQTWVLVPDATVESASEPEKAPGKTYEMRGFHKKIGNSKTQKAVKASRAVRRGDALEAGVIVDMGELKNQDLSKKDSDFLTRAREAFPALSDRDVYIGIEDRPGASGLSSSAKLRVGKLTYPLAEAAKKLGIDESQLRRQLNAELVKMNTPPGS